MGDYHLPSMTAGDALANPPEGWAIVDVRRRHAAAASGETLVGVLHVAPEALRLDHPVLRRARGLIFFCVHGHEVSQYATGLSLVAGTPARYVIGGFEALRAAGAPLTPWIEGTE